MRKTRIKTWSETLYRSHFHRLVKLRNGDESPTWIPCCSVKHLEKATIYPADNAFPEQSLKMMLSNRCSALILSPLRLMRVFSGREKLYRTIGKESKTELTVTSQTTTSNHSKGSGPIGQGAFGAVFRHVYNNRDVAIKHFHPSRHSPSSDFHSFCSELNAFRLPPSPYIVEAVAFTSFGISLQIVTEFIEGKNLQQLISDEMWKATFLDRLHLAFQVISGLVHCHDHLLLHLDVKPANIIVHVNGKVCKLSDFGCSRTAKTSQNGLLIARAEAANMAFGTIAYTAPELLKGQKVTDRADIYSFSMVLWEILAQKSAHTSTHPHIFIYDVVAHKLRPKIDQLNISKEMVLDRKDDKILITLLESCWSDEITKRPRAHLVQRIIKQFICSKKLLHEKSQPL